VPIKTVPNSFRVFHHRVNYLKDSAWLAIDCAVREHVTTWHDRRAILLSVVDSRLLLASMELYRKQYPAPRRVASFSVRLRDGATTGYHLAGQSSQAKGKSCSRPGLQKEAR
jgi:hypothetical protein